MRILVALFVLSFISMLLYAQGTNLAEHGKIGFEAGLEVGKWDMDYILDLKDISSYSPAYKNVYTFTFHNRASATLVFSIPLKDEPGLLSRIDVKVGYLFTSSELSPGYNIALYSAKTPELAYDHYVTFFNRKKRIDLYKSALSVSVPVLILNEKLSVHAGLSASVHLVNTKFFVEENHLTITGSKQNNTGIFYLFSMKKTHWEVSPVLWFQYMVGDFAVFSAYKAPAGFSAGVGYYWQF